MGSNQQEKRNGNKFFIETLLQKVKSSKQRLRTICIIVSAILVAIAVYTVVDLPSDIVAVADEQAEQSEPLLMYGIDYEGYEVVEKQVQNGETLSHMLDGYGLGQAKINEIAQVSNTLLDVRNINAGNKYVLFFKEDSLANKRLEHFVYEKSVTDYVVISLLNDEITVQSGQKDIDLVRRKVTANISSSLWNCIVDNDLPYVLSCELEDIYGWSVDFFALQDNDSFTVVYDEKYIDSLRVGIGRIWGAEFVHNGKTYYAIPFEQDGKISYWDENGNSLRKQLLKAPLKYTRISSKFSYSRLHPILKIRRPHLGVDYAAPSGTPVVAIADGVVTRKGWDSGGGGNMLRLKHANNLQSAYLHLKGYAKGISVGSHVSQGQVIGYVGATGMATGPHLDFRLYKGGTAIDPLKAPSEPTEPVKEDNKVWFNSIKDKVLAELNGDVSDEQKIMQADLESFRQASDSLLVDASQALDKSEAMQNENKKRRRDK